MLPIEKTTLENAAAILEKYGYINENKAVVDVLQELQKVNIDMWHGEDPGTVDDLDLMFYPNDGIYRGNLYRAGKMIGDFVVTNSLMLEALFPQLFVGLKEGSRS